LLSAEFTYRYWNKQLWSVVYLLLLNASNREVEKRLGCAVTTGGALRVLHTVQRTLREYVSDPLVTTTTQVSGDID
jgi:hypothetical protein